MRRARSHAKLRTTPEDRSTSPEEDARAWADVDARFPFLHDESGVPKRERKLLTARQSAGACDTGHVGELAYGASQLT